MPKPLAGARPRFLVIAYACVPGGGSEKGAGWAILKNLLSFADCVAIVPDKHVDDLNSWIDESGATSLTVVGVDEGRLGSKLQKPRIPLFLAYLLWLREVEAMLPSLVALHQVDLVWHATYSTFWLPTPIHQAAVPSVLGPIGGAVDAPDQLVPLLSEKGRKLHRIDHVVTGGLARRAAVARGLAAVDHVIVQNDETRREVDRYRAAGRPVSLLNHALGVDVPEATPTDLAAESFVWVGAMQERKGPELAIRALATVDEFTLVMVGGGPILERIKDLAVQLRVDDRVTFTGMLPRAEAVAIVAGAQGALFTGVHEEGGLALAETLLLGIPTVVLAHGGARTIAESATDSNRVRLVPVTRLDALAADLGTAMKELATVGRATGPLLDQDRFISALEQAAESATMVAP